LQASESKGLYNDRHPFETQIRRNDPPKSCEPYTAEKCRAVAEGLGLRLGGFGHAFEDNYSQKGCYAYRSGRYAGIAFYGSGGSDAEISNPRTKRGDTYRPLGWDCSVELLRTSSECLDNSMEKWLGEYQTVEDCAEACKRRNGCTNFIYGKNRKRGECYDEGRTFTEDECPEWEADQYDAYRLNDNQGDAPNGGSYPICYVAGVIIVSAYHN